MWLKSTHMFRERERERERKRERERLWKIYFKIYTLMKRDKILTERQVGFISKQTFSLELLVTKRSERPSAPRHKYVGINTRRTNPKLLAIVYCPICVCGPSRNKMRRRFRYLGSLRAFARSFEHYRYRPTGSNVRDWLRAILHSYPSMNSLGIIL